jgi:hypothetical protein
MAKKIGVNSNGKAWISPRMLNSKYYTNFYGSQTKLQIADTNSNSYKILKDIINRGNTICSRPYNINDPNNNGHNINLSNYGQVKRSRGWDCSSSACCILHPHIWKSNAAVVSGDMVSMKGFTSRGHIDKQKSIVVYANTGHIFLDIWWQGSKITWDNWGTRGSHTPWYSSPGSPNSPSASQYTITHKNL